MIIPKSQPKRFIYNKISLPKHVQVLHTLSSFEMSVWYLTRYNNSVVPILSDPLLSTSLASLPIQRKIWGERRKTEHWHLAHSDPAVCEIKTASEGDWGLYHSSNQDRGVESWWNMQRYLVWGIQKHDIIRGQVNLSELSWHLLCLWTGNRTGKKVC